MMFRLVPEWKEPTVITTGSKMSNCRVTIVCRAMTISQATGIGSRPRCGIDPWVPAPITRTSRPAEAAISVPRSGGEPTRRKGGGEHVQTVGSIRPSTGDLQHTFVEHPARTVVTFLAGLEHEEHVAGELVAMGAEKFDGADEARHVQVVAAGMHRVGVRGIGCRSEGLA